MENPSINIAKIEMSWFMAINGKRSVDLDRTNLIDGSHNAVKQSIAKAIDVMLCSEYENSTDSLCFRHESKDPRNKRQSYIKMHLIGTSDFVLNGEQSSQFHITRYFNKNDVDFVFTSAAANDKQNKQSIRKFHYDLANVEMLRSLDPFISIDCMPSGSDINQLIVKMIGLKEFATAANTLRNHYLVDSMQAFELLEISKMLNEKFAEIKDPMTQIRTLKCALITHQMTEINEKCAGVKEFGKHCRLLANDIKQNKLSKKLKVLQSVQDARCKQFNAAFLAERKAVEDLARANDQQHIARLNEAMDEFRIVFDTFVDQMKATREHDLKSFEQVIAQLEWHRVYDMQDPAQIAKEVKKHDAYFKKLVKFVDNMDVRRRTSEELKNQMNKGLQAISDNIGAMKKINDDFIGPAQKVFLFNRQKLENYQRSINLEIEMAYARVEMEKFYASDNWLSELQIEALQKGHKILSLYSNEFHKKFLGHIGQFIDVDTDFDVLRVALPILSKDYLSAFIFSRKDVADEFVKLFKETNPGKTIIAFGKDEWEGELEGDAPEGVSLDEKILTADTLQRYPCIKHFFQTFRITAGNKNHKYCQNIATNGIYKIFNGNIYYDETTFTHVRGAKNIAYLQSVVEKWVEMGKNLQNQLGLGCKKNEANKLMDECEKKIIAFEIELNKSRLQIRILEEKIATIVADHKKALLDHHASLKFKEEWLIKAKILRMKGDWLRNRSTLQQYDQSIVTGPRPNLNMPDVAELKLFAAIEKFANFYDKGFPLIVYQSGDFAKWKELLSNCQNIESPNFLIEPLANAVSDDDIERRLKRHSALEAAYKKLLILAKEKSELMENIDFCVLGMVEELAQNDRADLRRRLDEAHKNLPPGVILPGSDIKTFTEHLNLFDDDTHKDHRIVSAMIERNCLEASWHSKSNIRKYFRYLVDTLRFLNEKYDWNDQVFVFQLNTAANGTKTEYIDHENPDMPKWIRGFTVQQLCADDTRLNFYLKSNETGDYVINDQLDIKRHALATLLHTALSRAMNPSLFILNNTIVGRSSNEVADIIERHRPYKDGEAMAQLILFSRSDVDYRHLFDHPYKRIECRATNNNRCNIIQTDR